MRGDRVLQTRRTTDRCSLLARLYITFVYASRKDPRRVPRFQCFAREFGTARRVQCATPRQCSFRTRKLTAYLQKYISARAHTRDNVVRYTNARAAPAAPPCDAIFTFSRVLHSRHTVHEFQMCVCTYFNVLNTRINAVRLLLPNPRDPFYTE